MKNLTFFRIILFMIILLSFSVKSQNLDWINYTNGKDIRSIAFQGDLVWVATSGGGLVRINKVTEENVYYNKSNAGLGDNNVEAVALDLQGNLWLGTNYGIIYYNGTTAKIYNTANSGLPSNKISSIYIDSQNIKWIIIKDFGLVSFDGANWNVYNTSNSEIPCNNITSLAFDSKGNKWMGTPGYGLIKFDGTTWITYTKTNSNLPDNEVSSVAIDKQDNVWAGTLSGGLVKYNGSSWTIYNKATYGESVDYILLVAVDSKGSVWLVSGINTYQLWQFNGVTFEYIMADGVNTLAIDLQNNVWMGKFNPVTKNAYYGLTKYDGIDYKSYSTSNSGLPNNEITTVSIDPKGIKWFGTTSMLSGDGGLTGYDGSSWTTFDSQSAGIPYDYITTVNIDLAGNKWVGCFSNETGSGSLAKFDSNNWTIYNSENSSPLFSTSYIKCLAIDSSGNKWMGLYDRDNQIGKGLLRIDTTDWTVYDKSNSDIADININSIVIDKTGNKWMGTNGGLVKFDGVNWKVFNVSNSGLPTNTVGSMVFDASGNLWIACYDINDVTKGGLVKFNGIANWDIYNTDNSSLPVNKIYTLVIDSQGTIWIGTSQGLIKYDGTNWTLYNNANSGLSSEYITSIAIDSVGNRWIGTKDGVAFFSNNVSFATIKGLVTYNNVANTPLGNVKIKLMKGASQVAETITDIDGNFKILNVRSGSYTLQASSSSPVNGIDPGDALAINRNYIGLFVFPDKIVEAAADVTADGNIDPGDALLINRFYIQSVDSFKSPAWYFENPSIIMAGDNLLIELKGNCFGDLKGDYTLKK